MTQVEIASILSGGQEGLAFEFKQSMSWSNRTTQGKVIKSALAMANLRDGGVIVFGMKRSMDKSRHEMEGMTREDFASFNQDGIMGKVNSHANPAIDLIIQQFEIERKLFVVIQIRQFHFQPVICSKDFVLDGKPIVIRGRLYCRSGRTVETTEVQSADDMRYIIDIAVDVELKRFYQRQEAAGLRWDSSSKDLFREQLGDLAE